MANVHDVAAAILDEHGGPMSTMKLQKLVYYCQAWHLVWDDEPLFSDPIEAWAGGPVVRALYNRHRGDYTVRRWDSGDSSRLQQNERETVEAVVREYGRLSGQQLSHLTHRERPWRSARRGLGPGERGNRPIDLEEMVDFYSALADDEDATPVSDLAVTLPNPGGEPR